MAAYYNEIDPFAAQWLRELIAQGFIADGVVDERSITEVQPDDLREFTQCHFFAGIGGWSFALRLAGVPDDFSIYTGSCPCQPFSVAGQKQRKKGVKDERHLWPFFGNLISKCAPAIVVGEQVEAAIAHHWLDIVADDLENLGYACGAAVIPAASLGAPHVRSRLYWAGVLNELVHGSAEIQLANPSGNGFGGRYSAPSDQRSRELQLDGEERISRATSIWSNTEWRAGKDGIIRPHEPLSFPLAYGIPARVGRLRGYGNAIVPQVGATFVRVLLESCKLL